MASLVGSLSSFLLVLIFSVQIQARESRFFSKITHHEPNNNNNDDITEPKTPLTKAPAPAPTSTITMTPTPAPAPTLASESLLPPTPAPAPTDGESQDGYGLYGREYHYPTTEETPTTNTSEDELLEEDLLGEASYKTGYSKTNGNYNENYHLTSYDNDGKAKGYAKYNVEGGGYSVSNNNENSYSNNKYKYNRNGYNNYENERIGMSDTRVLENGKYYYELNNDDKYNNVNGHDESAGRGSFRNEGYYDNSKYPNEYDTMEEYYRQQESQGYMP